MSQYTRRVSGEIRVSERGGDREVRELGCGILVYPPVSGGAPWRAVFYESGKRRNRQAVTELRGRSAPPALPAACCSHSRFDRTGQLPSSTWSIRWLMGSWPWIAR